MTTIERTRTAPAPTPPPTDPEAAARRQRLVTVLWHLGALAVLAVLLYPVLWVISSSLKPADEILARIDLLPSTFEWGNYATATEGIAEVSALRFFANSTVIAVGSVIGNVLSCSLAAYAFARLRFRLQTPMFAFMIITIMLPQHVLLIPQYVLFNKLGMVDTFLPLLIGKFLATEAFFVFLMVQFMRNLPRELDEAALIDGCGHAKIFWHVVLPLTRPAIITTSIFTFIWAWNDFFGPLIYLQSPEKYPLPLALRMFVDQSSSSDYGAMLAMSMLALAPVVIFFIAFQRLLIEGVQTSGLKG